MEDDISNGIDDVSTTRRGRFRVSAPPAGPPETTVGRFRLVPQTGNYGPASPFLQRGRFSVIPEEPQNSPGAGPNVVPTIVTTDRQASPDWDFDDEKTVQEYPMVVQSVKTKQRLLYFRLAAIPGYSMCLTTRPAPG
ncbi:AAEL008659-PA [Aedes aegypti]|uniref:AAEL008659-PA n=1 Tax=Aedes aegypti TaxID=7159 RepID=Q16Y56_AEDAE|nr:AAEL008659-PA [Aedes aegypti]